MGSPLGTALCRLVTITAEVRLLSNGSCSTVLRDAEATFLGLRYVDDIRLAVLLPTASLCDARALLDAILRAAYPSWLVCKSDSVSPCVGCALFFRDDELHWHVASKNYSTMGLSPKPT